MNTCAVCECPLNRLNFNLGPLTPDGRLPMVKRVLDLLVESRYGSGSYSEPLPAFGENKDPAPIVNLDLHPQRFYDGSASGARKIVKSASPLSAMSESLVRILDLRRLFLTASPTNLGRGSPTATNAQ